MKNKYWLIYQSDLYDIPFTVFKSPTMKGIERRARELGEDGPRPEHVFILKGESVPQGDAKAPGKFKQWGKEDDQSR